MANTLHVLAVMRIRDMELVKRLMGVSVLLVCGLCEETRVSACVYVSCVYNGVCSGCVH